MNEGEGISYSTRIRKLKPSVISRICLFIDQNDDWKRFAAHIPNTLGRPGLLYSPEQISSFARAVQQRGGSPTKEVLKDWGTRNIIVDQLISVLKHQDVSLLHVVAYLEELIPASSSHSADHHVLYEQTPQMHPCNDVPSSARTTISSPTKLVDTGADEKSDRVHSYTYCEVEAMTQKFNNDRLIGRGGFSTVYLGYLGDQMLAVKRLDCADKSQTSQFKTELNVLKEFKHKNLLPIVGVSDDGDHFCIVYPYMVNGSLEDRLACKKNTAPLTWLVRVSIAKGTAEAITYLHTSQANIVHRDIKSANVLLDKDLVPKLGDFGLARQGPANKTALQTSNVIGTAAYMAPEAIHGTITDKLDAFSFGVVLLELVTGLPSFDGDRIDHTLTNLLDSHEYLAENLTDKTAGDWGPGVAQKLVDIAKKLTKYKPKKRARVLEVMEELRAIEGPQSY